MPEASARQVQEQAKKNWAQLPNVPAVKDNRVTILTDWYVLQPGSHVGDLAEETCGCAPSPQTPLHSRDATRRAGACA